MAETEYRDDPVPISRELTRSLRDRIKERREGSSNNRGNRLASV